MVSGQKRICARNLECKKKLTRAEDASKEWYFIDRTLCQFNTWDATKYQVTSSSNVAAHA